MENPGDRAVRDAAELWPEIDRLIRPEPSGAHPETHRDSRTGDPIRRFRADAERALDLAFDTLADIGDVIGEWLRGSRSRHHDAIVLGPVAPGGTSDAQAWLHNTTERPLLRLEPRLSPLIRHDGTQLDPSDVSCTPDHLAGQQESSEQITLRLEPGPDSAPGRYFGFLLVTGLPDMKLPVTAIVEPPE